MNKVKLFPVLTAFSALILMLIISQPSPAAASGGITIPAGDPGGKVKKARLLPNGQAQAPDNAPPAIFRAIRAANQIEDRRYCWGGGHGAGKSACYDCSGSLSYVLKAAGLLKRAKTSGALMSWGRRGAGKWLTVYANRRHTFAVIAGLRWDTASAPGSGPGWSKQSVATRSFATRHWTGL